MIQVDSAVLEIENIALDEMYHGPREHEGMHVVSAWLSRCKFYQGEQIELTRLPGLGVRQGNERWVIVAAQDGIVDGRQAVWLGIVHLAPIIVGVLDRILE